MWILESGDVLAPLELHRKLDQNSKIIEACDEKLICHNFPFDIRNMLSTVFRVPLNSTRHVSFLFLSFSIQL